MKKFLVLLLLMLAPPAVAAPWYELSGPSQYPSSVGAMPRKILAFYDGRSYSDIFFTPIHQLAEMPLNFLGLEVVYRDINDSLPKDSELAGFRGIITWFNKKDVVSDAVNYCTWMNRQITQGLKLVVLGRLGVAQADTETIAPVCQTMLKSLGVRYLGQYTETPYFFDIVSKDSKMVEFERDLSLSEDLKYLRLKLVDLSAKVYLTLQRQDLPNSESAVVLTNRHGGLAYESYVNYEHRDLKRMHWRINPYAFFETAYQVAGLPRPDPTTLNGRRIFFSHIDGDGIFNISHIDQKSYSGEIIVQEILQPNPDIPITTSIIAGYLDLPQFRDERSQKLYHEIFAQPNVEAAAHGYAHPLVWKKETVALKIPGYHYNTEKEVRGAVAMVDQLLQELHIPKKVTLYSWTGNCLLPANAIREAYLANVANMNGGDTRFDRHNDSYSFVFPLSIIKQGWRQIYASASNENTYTNLWEGPYYGYGEVVETFENTDHPYRVKPINVYYHYYSGERQAALQAVRKAYEYVRTHKVMPIVTSRYSQIVADFFATTFYSIAGGYRVETQGQLKTIRFDRESRQVDLVRSRGVLGYTYENDALYVHLGEGQQFDVILTSASPRQPYVRDASFDLRNFMGTAQKLEFDKSGWLNSEIVLGGMLPRHGYKAIANGETLTAQSDARGQLTLTFSTSERGQGFQHVLVRAQ